MQEVFVDASCATSNSQHSPCEPCEAEVYDEVECMICLCGFEDNVPCQRLPCCPQHAFHFECITGWLNAKRQCPLCDRDPGLAMWDMSFCRGLELSINIFKGEANQSLGLRFQAPVDDVAKQKYSLARVEALATDSLAKSCGLEIGDVIL